MDCQQCWLTIRPSRRNFLRATSLLAGSAVFGALDARCCETAANQPAGPSGDSTSVVTIRGHHLFDMLDALGTGKSSHKTLGPVAQRIRANPKVPIKLTIGVDDICGPCEWWDYGKSLCKRGIEEYPRDNENSLTSDKNAIRVLGVKPGDEMPADALYRLIQTKVDKKVFAEEVCVACRLVDKCKETYQLKITAAVKALCSTQSK
ncbi:MAG: DUF1284 domain-containing protein [Planctomycetaceae bacterium]|nr:DUF1284 domain-containing protein [Planctomycetaceae bacterium]